MLQVRSLQKAFNDRQAVDNVSLDVRKGEAFGLLGPNGAGKTTTISMISGLIQPDSGTITVGGFDLAREPVAVRRLLGVVPQEIALYPTLTAAENLRFWGRMYGLQGGALSTRVSTVLDQVGLADRARDRVETYSGGMKRRLNIAASLLHEPQLLIMDEPTVGIDPQSRNHILETVRLLTAAGLTVIYTSHYMEEVEFLCNQVAIMDHGRVIASGSLSEVKQLAGGDVTVELELAAVVTGIGDRLRDEAGVRHVAGDELTFTALMDSRERLGGLIDAVQQAGGRLQGVQIQEPNLEAVFLHLTGRSLRD